MLSVSDNEKPLIFEAAIFADGSSYGAPCWAGRIVRHRKIVYRTATRGLDVIEQCLKNRMSFGALQELLAETENEITIEHPSEEERMAAAWVFRGIHTRLRSDPQGEATMLERVEPALEWLAPLLVRLRTSNPRLTGGEPVGPPPACKDATRPQ